MESQKISQKEYLKRYLSTKDDGKKKKKKKIKVGPKTVQIIDDDIDLKKLIPIDDDEISILNTTEDAPQIVGIIDERGPIDFGNKQRWKLIADDGTGDIQISKVHLKRNVEDNDSNNDLKNKKQSVLKDSKKEKKKSKNKSYEKKNKKCSSDSSSSSESEKEIKDHRKGKKKKKKDLSKRKKKSKRNYSSSSDSSSDSDSDSNSDTDSDLSLPRPHKTKKTTSKNKKQISNSDLSPVRNSKRKSKKRKLEKEKDGNDSDFSLSRPNRKDKLLNRKRQDSNSDLSLSRNSKYKNCRKSSSDMNYISQNNSYKKSHDRSRKRSVDSDLSPPRSNKDIQKTLNKKTYSSDSNSSSVRSNKKTKILDRRKMYDSKQSENFDKYHEFDVNSEPTSKKSKILNKFDLNYSPVRNSKSKDERNSDKHDSDLSPPRNSKSKNDKRSGKQDSDLSPPRISKSKNDKRYDKYDSDLSPPRNSRHDKDPKKCNSNHGPQRNTNFKQDRYLPKNETNYSSEHKSSSKYSRDSNKYDSNLSSRNSKQEGAKSSHYSNQRRKVSRWDEEKKLTNKEKHETENKKMKKTLDGTSAGLQNLKSLKEEEEAQKKREAELMKNMGKEISGYGQTTIVRDRRTGRKRDLEKENAEKREKQKAQNEINEKYSKWGKGLKQMEDREDKLKRDLHEMNKPLARYADDEDLDRELRARDRTDDPMLAYIKEKEIKEGKRAPEKPKFEGTYMPNRFGINPGYRWDGVDRSNGYEKKWFEARNTKKAVEEEAYKWSTADM